jgi:hypothetical protein
MEATLERLRLVILQMTLVKPTAIRPQMPLASKMAFPMENTSIKGQLATMLLMDLFLTP